MEYGSFQAEEFGDLQRLVDGLFYDRHAIDRLDLIVQAPVSGCRGQKIANMSTVTFLVTAILN